MWFYKFSRLVIEYYIVFLVYLIVMSGEPSAIIEGILLAIVIYSYHCKVPSVNDMKDLTNWRFEVYEYENNYTIYMNSTIGSFLSRRVIDKQNKTTFEFIGNHFYIEDGEVKQYIIKDLKWMKK